MATKGTLWDFINGYLKTTASEASYKRRHAPTEGEIEKSNVDLASRRIDLAEKQRESQMNKFVQSVVDQILRTGEQPNYVSKGGQVFQNPFIKQGISARELIRKHLGLNQEGSQSKEYEETIKQKVAEGKALNEQEANYYNRFMVSSFLREQIDTDEIEQENIELPTYIKTTSQAIDYLKSEHKMSDDDARAWLQNANAS